MPKGTPTCLNYAANILDKQISYKCKIQLMTTTLFN